MAYDMRSALPVFGSLPGLQEAFGAGARSGDLVGRLSPHELLFATLFPQFMSAQAGPQYGRHTPDWRNAWARDAHGYGLPIPMDAPPEDTMQGQPNVRPPNVSVNTGADPMPWIGGDYIWQGFGGGE